MRKFTAHLSAAFILCTIFAAGSANAALVQGSYLGTFSGNDNVSSVFANTGYNVFSLGRVNTPALEEDGLSIENTMFNDDNEGIAGSWSYAGPQTADLIVIKAGNQYSVFLFDAANNGGMPNMGLWDTSTLDDKGLSHITAYSITAVPLPAGIWLLASGLIGLAGMRRRS